MSKSKNRFYKECHVCNGDKYLYSLEWQEYYKKFDEVEQNLIDQGKDHSIKAVKDILERQGIFEPDCPEEYPCYECDGKGVEPTEEGKQILDFLYAFDFITKDDMKRG